MISLGANIAAIRVQRSLDGRTGDLSGTYTRLASGRRINRASDDAAGLAIADRLRATTRVAQVAIRNANDAISSINIADGAVEQQSLVLGRLAELAEQAANGTLSGRQRSTLQREYAQLIAEFGRVGDSTKFNGISLLRRDRINLQVGLDGTLDSILALQGIATNSLSGTLSLEKFTTPDINNVGGVTVDDLFTFLAPRSLNQLVEDFENNYAMFDIQQSDGSTRRAFVSFVRSHVNDTFSATVFLEQPDGTYSASANSINRYLTLYFGGSGTLSVDAEGYITNQAAAVIQETVGSGSLSLDLSTLSFRQQVSQTALEFTRISTASDARLALDSVRARLDELARYRGEFGATQSRLSTTLAVLGAAAENSAAAESRIRDADIAGEAAALTRLTILQQVGAAIMAQARTSPQLALTLLRT